VESSTHEDFYRPNGFEARIVYLQKAGTVGDQSFDSFAIFAKEAKSVIATSRRNDESTKVVLEIKTVIAMLLALSGFVAQFAGLRSMNWSATIAQLVAALLMTAFRAFVRRDLARIPTTEKLPSGVELDWLATRLAFRLFHDPPDKGNERDMATAPETSNAKKESGRTEAQESANSWLKPSTNNHPASPRTSSASRDTSATSRQQTWIFKVVDASEASYQETHKASIAHYAMRLRKGLGDLAPWPRPLSAEARAVVTAIESTMNYLDSQSVFSSLTTKNNRTLFGRFGIPRRHHNSPKDGSFVWHVETLRHGKIYFTVNKRKNGRWEASEPEIEAALSLWGSDDFLHELERDSTLAVDDVSLPRDGAMARRTLQLLGPSSARLRRDLRWWLPEEMAKVLTVRAVREPTEAARATGPRDEEYHGVFGCGHSDDCPGWTERVRYRTAELQRPYDTTSSFPGTIPTPRFPRNELLLATVREQPARGLFAQHLFTAFMWALVNKRVQRPIPGRANIQASDLSQLDVSPHSWQLFTLQNQHLSRMVQDIHAAGLGSHNDILLCIIPPLSLAHRLPQTESVVKWAHQHLIGPGMTGRWSEVVDGFIWLLGTFPDGDPIHTHLVPLAVSVLVLLAQECMVRKRQMYPKREVEELELLKSDLESMLKTASAAHHSLSVARKHSSAWITRVADTIKLGEPPFPAVEYCYPNPIRIAMESSSNYELAESLKKPANLGIRDAFGRTALHYVKCSDVWDLLKIHATVNTQDCLGWSPLHLASSQHVETSSIKVARLIQAGADVGLRSLDGLAPLHCAAMAGATKSVMELVEAGADVNALDSLRNTALHWAAFLGHDEVVTKLLGLTNQELRNNGGRTVFHQLALSDDAIATQTQYESLLQQGYDAGAKDRLGRVALHYAASNGHEEATKSVLFPKHGADGIDMEDNQRMRPVDFAAARGHDNLAIYLFQHKAGSEQVYHRDENGATILHHAAAGNCSSLLQSLLSVEGGIDPLSLVDNAKATALHYATQNVRTESLELLAETQPDMVLAKDGWGRTALHLAAMNGHRDCVLYLETKLTGRGEERWPVIPGLEYWEGGKTPLHLAVKHAGNVGMVKHLLENGCPIDHQDQNGYTALHLAAATGDVAVVKLLLEWKPQGTQADATTKTGSTVLACAAYHGSLETVDFLMRSGADIKMRDDCGKTTFLAAAGQSHDVTYWNESLRRITAHRKIDILRLLVEAGANPHDVDREGQSAQELLFVSGAGRSDDDMRCRQLVAGYLEGLSLL
jgi:ankyrin repeat protein